MTVTTREKSRSTQYKSHRQAVAENVIRTFFRYLLLLVIGVIMLLPFIMAFLGTVKTDQEILAYPPKFLPEVWHWENWARVWNTDLGAGGTFPRWLFNTAFLSVTVAVSQAAFGSMAAYAFSRLKFAGYRLQFYAGDHDDPRGSHAHSGLRSDDQASVDQHLLVVDLTWPGQRRQHFHPHVLLPVHSS